MPRIFLTADHHFNHPAIVKATGTWGWRDFAGVDDMNEALLEAWNRVYHLGDFMWARHTPSPQATALARRLHGQIYLIRGNHDHTNVWPAELLERFVWIRDRHELRVPALWSWNRRAHGALHLFGHVHGALDDDLLPGTLDVGVDSWNYEPVALEKVLAAIDATTYWHDRAQNYD